MESKTLKSGHVLQLAIADFGVACKLRRIVAAELLKVDLDITKIDLQMDLAKMDPGMLRTMKDIVCVLMASEAVEQAFLACAGRCLLQGQRITKETFEPEDMRGDYLPTAWEVISLNLAVFFEGFDFKSTTQESPSSARPA